MARVGGEALAHVGHDERKRREVAAQVADAEARVRRQRAPRQGQPRARQGPHRLVRLLCKRRRRRKRRLLLRFFGGRLVGSHLAPYAVGARRRGGDVGRKPLQQPLVEGKRRVDRGRELPLAEEELLGRRRALGRLGVLGGGGAQPLLQL
eukprot:4412192-Prymnesium_polylepis.1